MPFTYTLLLCVFLSLYAFLFRSKYFSLYLFRSIKKMRFYNNTQRDFGYESQSKYPKHNVMLPYLKSLFLCETKTISSNDKEKIVKM